MTVRVNVILKDEVILIISLFHHSQQVPGLEARLKKQSAIVWTLKLVHLLGADIVGFHFVHLYLFKVLFVILHIMLFNQLLDIQ